MNTSRQTVPAGHHSADPEMNIPNPGIYEGNDPFGLRRFSLRRYSVRHMLMLTTTLGILCAVTARAAWAQDWFILGLAAAGLALTGMVMSLMLRATVRRVIVEQWIRRLGMGDFDYTVEPWGSDELSKCCVALETLRLRAIEAMQLNEVQRLSQELQVRNGELESALEDLRRTQDQVVSRQKLAELGELSAGVAHEIRNPLQFIRSFAEDADSVGGQLVEVVERVARQVTPEEREEINNLTSQLKEDVGRVVRNTDRADRVVADMLALHRDSRGEFQPVDLNRLVEQQTMVAYWSVQAQLDGFAADVRLDLEPEMGETQAIPEDLGRVITNLVTNACQALAERAESAGPDGYEPALLVSIRRAEGAVEIRVWDNGTGMTEEVRTKIFNPFFTTKGPNRGTGLGLSFCFDVAREHGGTIEARSEQGEFTEMLVRLPAESRSEEQEDVREPEDDRAEPAISPEHRNQKATIRQNP